MSESNVLSEEPYLVVINDEEQYSIWLEGRPVPAGWKPVGFSGSRQSCLDHIESVWTDMRPRSLRDWLESAPEPEPAKDAAEAYVPLGQRLSEGRHPIVVSGMGEGDRDRFLESVKRGYVLIRFTETKGGTEVGLRFSPNDVDIPSSNDSSPKSVRLSGALTLDGIRLHCHTEIQLKTLEGEGWMEKSDA